MDKDKDSENVPKLESAEIVLVHCNLVKNDYHVKRSVYFCSKQKIWRVNKYFTTFLNDNEHS